MKKLLGFVFLLAFFQLPSALANPYCESGRVYQGHLVSVNFQLTGAMYYTDNGVNIVCEVMVVSDNKIITSRLPRTLVDLLFTLEDVEYPDDNQSIGTMYIQNGTHKILYFSNNSHPKYSKPELSGIQIGYGVLYDQDLPYKVYLFNDDLGYQFAIFENGSIYRLKGVPSELTFT